MAPCDRRQTKEPPFPAVRQLCGDLDERGPASLHVPGYPSVSLQDQHSTLDFLEKEYCSTDLDRIASRLWWMSKQDSANISPLHRQRVKGRSIVVAEDPKLHLVWIRDRVFVKPLPRALTSYAFWRDYLGADADVDADNNAATCAQEKAQAQARALRIRRAALGYLRTYFYLVKSEHDFHIAQDPSLRLIPEGITWEQFSLFVSCLASVPDRDVSGRYAYGEIRLTRLNMYAPLLLGKTNFQRVYYQSGEYFAHFYAPILFLIGMTSVVLSAFQIAVGVEQASPSKYGGSLLGVALWFSVLIIVGFCFLFGSLCLLLFYKIAKEWRYAIRDRRRNLEDGGPCTHGA